MAGQHSSDSWYSSDTDGVRIAPKETDDMYERAAMLRGTPRSGFTLNVKEKL
jgi:hypothetical protein